MNRLHYNKDSLYCIKVFSISSGAKWTLPDNPSRIDLILYPEDQPDPTWPNLTRIDAQ